MLLPNALSRVKDAFNTKKDRQAELMERLELRNKIFESATAAIKNTDPTALAYLWIAVEQKQNLLLLTDKNAGAETFIDLLSCFVPSYHNVQEIGSSKLIDKRANFTTLCPNGNYLGSQMAYAEKTLPDRLIVREDSSLFISKLFKLSKFGVSFVAPLKGNFSDRPFIQVLKSKEFGVKPQDISNLDVLLSIKNVEEMPAISSIVEYDWLERGEIKPNINEFLHRNFRNTRLLKNVEFECDLAIASKLIKGYARINVLNESAAMGELARRSKFLEHLSKKGPNAGISNPIEMYYEIK